MRVRQTFGAGVRATLAAVAVAAAMVAATPTAGADPLDFYSPRHALELASFAPGAVLDTRTVAFHLSQVPTPLTVIQIVYRSTDARGNAVANVTSVIKPVGVERARGVVSFQSAYDSLNPEDGPSRAIAGDAHIGGFTDSGGNLAIGALFPSGEATMFARLLMQGYSVVIADTEGQQANFSAGPEYGMNTLDSLRAAASVADTGITPGTPTVLMGYSGGAIASNWAAILAPDYAPDINAQLIGVAQGGLLVNPAHTQRYASGSAAWGGVVGMAVVGVSRSYGIDLDPYLSDYGRQILTRFQDASILNVLGQYPGLSWQQLVQPRYADPDSIPELVEVSNKINMGLAPTPTIPMYVAQGTAGVLEGTTPGGPGIGDGDGIMVAGDARALMNRYCAAGVAVQYNQFDYASHLSLAPIWTLQATAWITDRFAARPVPSNCNQIPPGNSLDAVVARLP
ncbi:lipase family protein [Nocardia sp. NPDC057455]|uniref:lipase family protein n=1 Tax=Nocardia sp. NPDC057455 TaxID=3346138 RepID=UPI003670057F